MYRVTVSNGRKTVAWHDDVSVADFSSAGLELAGRATCSAKNVTFPRPATVRVDERESPASRWRKVAEKVV